MTCASTVRVSTCLQTSGTDLSGLGETHGVPDRGRRRVWNDENTGDKSSPGVSQQRSRWRMTLIFAGVKCKSRSTVSPPGPRTVPSSLRLK